MIEVGDAVPNLAITVYDASGALADGGTVTCTITLPDNVTTVLLTLGGGVTRVSVGQYTAAYTAIMTGYHKVLWTITGANFGAHDDSFNVERYASSIVSLTDVKQFLKINRTADDEILRLLSVAASDACESTLGTGKIWRQRTFTNEPHDGGGGSIRILHPPILSVTSLTVDGTALSVSDYDIASSSGQIYATAGYFGISTRRQNVLVTYVAGATSVPPLVRIGVLEMVRHLYGIHRGGAELPSQDEPTYTAGYLIPNRVASAWEPHRAANCG